MLSIPIPALDESGSSPGSLVTTSDDRCSSGETNASLLSCVEESSLRYISSVRYIYYPLKLQTIKYCAVLAL